MASTGKQARAANVDESPRTKHDNSPPQQQQHHQQPPVKTNMAPPAASEPTIGNSPPRQVHAAVPGAYSAAPGDIQNRVAQAGHAAAHHAEIDQDVAAKTKSKRVPDESIAKLVAEENASKSKFPRYPGLEKWELLEKMGDGAFSNVYRARDLQGTHGEVAIKVVRKFEMNSMQVRDQRFAGASLLGNPQSPVSFHSCRVSLALSFLEFLYQLQGSFSRATNISIRTLKGKPPRLQRCDQSLILSDYEPPRSGSERVGAVLFYARCCCPRRAAISRTSGGL